MNDDDRTRDAIHRVVAGAPRPVPYEQLAADTANSKVPSNRAWLAVAAVMIALAGVAGVVWATTRDGGTTAPATVPSVAPQPTQPASVPTSEPHTQPATTSPVASSLPDTTVATAPVEPAELFPVAHGIESLTAIAPSGSIDAAPGDLVSLSVDGDLYLHRGAFDPDQHGRTPAAPIRLVDGADPRVPVEEGPGPNGVSWVGGFVNGALIYGDCCEPVVGNVYALSDAEGPRANLRYGSAGAADPTGRRWALVDSFGLQVLDFDSGRGYARNHADESQYNNDVLWSPGGTEVWVIAEVFADDGSRSDVLIRYDSSALVELGRTELTPSAGEGALATFGFAGRTDGAVVVTEYGPDGVLLRALDPQGRELLDESEWSLPVGASSVHLSPDGATVAYTLDGTAYLQPRSQDPVPWATDTSAVWFVTTPAMPRGTADCAETDDQTPPWQYADLDGDGVSERIVVSRDSQVMWIAACGSSAALDVTEVYAPASERTVTPVDVEGDGQTELWVSGMFEEGLGERDDCVAVYRFADSHVVPTTEHRCIGGTTMGFACVAVDGVVQPVFYERDGLTLTAVLDDGTVLGTHTYASEDEFSGLFDLDC